MYSDNESLKDELGVRRRVSVVWNYFEKLSKLRVRCRLCQHEQNYQGTTGNILRHLKNKHNVDCSQKAQKEQMSAASNNSNSQQTKKEEHGELVTVGSSEHELLILKSDSPTPSILNCVNNSKDAVLDPYAEDYKTFDDYVNMDVAAAKNSESTRKADVFSDEKQGSSIEEERLKAEIDYLREKAGFYKMMKTRTALQAQKVKYELEHMA